MTLYDATPVELFRTDDVENWFRDPDFWAVGDQITDECLQQGKVDTKRVTDLCKQGMFNQVAVLAGLDEALLFASPWSTSHDQEHMVAILGRYLESGRLNDATPGALLPRRSYPGRPMSGKEKHHYFRVVRVSDDVWGSGYTNTALPSDRDVWFRPGEPVSVGCVPVLSSYDDLEFSYPLDPQTGESRYALKPRARIVDRLKIILTELEDSGAQLGILPEACLSADVYKAWKDLLRDTPPSRHSKLRWILLGSGPIEEHGNTAILVDRWTGDELLRQDKLADFALTDWQVISWGLPGPAPTIAPGTVLREDIPRSVTFWTQDSFLGRLGVLICESLSRWPDSRQREVVQSSVSHVFAPVFSKPIWANGWEDRGSAQLSDLVGSWVVVSNSLATADKLKPSLSDPWFTCLVAGPFEEERKSYRMTQLFGRSLSAQSPATVYLPANFGDAPQLPTLRSASIHLSWFPELRR
ncbi:hypothetical protein [Blastococcus sp. SYSU DS0619]